LTGKGIESDGKKAEKGEKGEKGTGRWAIRILLETFVKLGLNGM
jgi:hypothetical protein